MLYLCDVIRYQHQCNVPNNNRVSIIENWIVKGPTVCEPNFFSPFCPNFMKEGGGPKAEQIVLIFLSQLGGEGGGQ